MAIGTLEAIINKVRLLAVAGNSFQLTDAQIIDYINSFYLYDFPAEFRSLKLKDKYTFNTVRGIDTYPFDSEHFTTVEMPCYCAKREIKLFQDPWSFWGTYFNWQYQVNFATGDGTTGTSTGTITGATQANPCVITSAAHGLSVGELVTITGVVGMTELNDNTYTITAVTANTFTINVDSSGFTPYVSDGAWSHSSYEVTSLSAAPLIRSVNNNPMVQTTLNSTNNFLTSPSVPSFPNANISRSQNILITANSAFGATLNVTDDGNGNLIGDCTSGTIDYENGQIANLNFTSSVPSGEHIQIQYNCLNSPNQMSIPQGILFFQNQFTLRPVPDKGYTVELIAYRMPSQVLLGTTSTESPTMSGQPELVEWWETLAFGAAKKIYQDRLDPDGVALMDLSLKEAYMHNEVRTYAQLGKQQMSTIFRDQLQQSYGGSGWFGSV